MCCELLVSAESVFPYKMVLRKAKAKAKVEKQIGKGKHKNMNASALHANVLMGCFYQGK